MGLRPKQAPTILGTFCCSSCLKQSLQVRSAPLSNDNSSNIDFHTNNNHDDHRMGLTYQLDPAVHAAQHLHGALGQFWVRQSDACSRRHAPTSAASAVAWAADQSTCCACWCCCTVSPSPVLASPASAPQHLCLRTHRSPSSTQCCHFLSRNAEKRIVC